ncbi:MAG: DedA family protein [Rickettsiales bacterium]|nr:MAG: DedA family protein [Rickettsiales bacterium]
MTEIYSLLFTDIFTSNLVFCFSDEIVIASMKIFDSYNKLHIIIIATLAYFLVSCFNYFFGSLCYKILAPLNKDHVIEPNKTLLQLRNGQLIYVLLVLSGIPFFGKFIIFLTGFVRVNFFKTIIIAIVSKLIYYIYFMMF